MFEPTTARCGLPLLQPSQAQKHVTVNDALLRLDGLVNLVLQSVAAATPPETVTDGQCWAVPFGASGGWEGKAGQIAVGANGGWVFATPQRGQQAFVLDRGVTALWDGANWAEGAITLGVLGGGLYAGVTEGEVDIMPGASLPTSVRIPAQTLVVGVSARVVQTISGTLTSWSLGIAGAAGRFGSGLGLEQNSWAQGLQSSPTTYYTEQKLLMTAVGGNFAAGRVRLSIQWFAQRLPTAV